MIDKINIKSRECMKAGSHADINMCWTCGSCDAECPMNIATNRLRPQKLLRFAYTGLFNDLIGNHDIWYCLTCRRCSSICPNRVKPADVIEYARTETLRSGIVTHEQYRHYLELYAKFQRVRWHMAEWCLNGYDDTIDNATWLTWYETPITSPTDTIFRKSVLNKTIRLNDLKSSPCFTCGECSSACPISGSRNVFDPRYIFRMANFGMTDELLSSPMIWLCLNCGRCTDACSQLVDGCQIIQDLQMMAIQSGAVDPDISLRIRDANKYIYRKFVEEVDALLIDRVRAVA